jgi:hypothetical protein
MQEDVLQKNALSEVKKGVLTYSENHLEKFFE